MSADLRKKVRLIIACILLITLPLFGFLLGVENHISSLILVGGVVVLGVLSLELIALSIERDLKQANLRIREDVAEFDEWKEKVRELERIVALISTEKQEFRRERFDAKLREITPSEA